MRFAMILRGFLTVLGVLLLGTPSVGAQPIMEDYPSITLQGLDKSVGRTITFEAKVGSTIQYGPLYIKIHACRKAPPMETPESAAFLQVWEVPPGAQKSEWVFSGWMFASSPALSAMDHPVYDVWVLDCTGRAEPNEEAREAETMEEADQDNLPAAESDFFEDGQGGEAILDAEAMPDEGDAYSPAQSNNAVETPLPEAQPISPDDDSSERDIYQPLPVPGYQDTDAPAEAQMQVIEDGGYPQQPAPRDDMPSFDPGQDGIYSPSQGRVVPAQPQPQPAPQPQTSPYPHRPDLPSVY